MTSQVSPSVPSGVRGDYLTIDDGGIDSADESDGASTQDLSTGIEAKVDAIASTVTIIDHQFKCGVNKRIKDLQEESEKVLMRLDMLERDMRGLREKWSTNQKTGEPEDVFRRMNSMIDFLYSWVKGAEASGVFKLPPKCF